MVEKGIKVSGGGVATRLNSIFVADLVRFVVDLGQNSSVIPFAVV